jgi:hypothetical protein
MATAASLKFPSPSGIPTMVRQRSNPRNTCAIAIHAPASRNQSTFPTVDAALASKIHPTSEADAERALGGSQMPSRAPGDVRA